MKYDKESLWINIIIEYSQKKTIFYYLAFFFYISNVISKLLISLDDEGIFIYLKNYIFDIYIS